MVCTSFCEWTQRGYLKEVEHTKEEAAEMLDILEHGTLSSELEQTRGLSCKW
jgi:hypothetical protein